MASVLAAYQFGRIQLELGCSLGQGVWRARFDHSLDVRKAFWEFLSHFGFSILVDSCSVSSCISSRQTVGKPDGQGGEAEGRGDPQAGEGLAQTG